MRESLRVFVNGTGVNVPPGSTVLDAVQAADPSGADAVRGGSRAVADSRGIVVPVETLVSGGYVMRLVSSRQKADASDTRDAE